LIALVVSLFLESLARCSRIGLTHKDIHEARIIRDAEDLDLSVVIGTSERASPSASRCVRSARSSAMSRPRKISFGEMRAMGVRGVLIYCTDYRCSHTIAVMADHWADEIVGLRRVSFVAHVASKVPTTSGPTSTGTPPAAWDIGSGDPSESMTPQMFRMGGPLGRFQSGLEVHFLGPYERDGSG
jgi:hypothetical protein